MLSQLQYTSNLINLIQEEFIRQFKYTLYIHLFYLLYQKIVTDNFYIFIALFYILVESVSKHGYFETGLFKESQIRVHVLLAYIYGIKQLIVCCNKINCSSVKYSQQRFNEVKAEMIHFLKKLGFSPKIFLLCQLQSRKVKLGSNITNNAWYDGPTLLYAMQSLQVPQRNKKSPLRIIVDDIFKIPGLETLLTGRVVAGTLYAGMEIECAHRGIKIQVVSIERNKKQVQQTTIGQTIAMKVKYIQGEQIKKGIVLVALKILRSWQDLLWHKYRS